MASVDVQQPSASELMLKRMMSQQQREYEAEQALQEKKAAGEEVDELGVQYPQGEEGKFARKQKSGAMSCTNSCE